MRRIIERVVTVVTTTTWKISWEQDSRHAQPTADPVSDEFPDLDVLPEATPPAPTVTEPKEAYSPETKSVSNVPAERLPEDPDFYRVKNRYEES